MKKHDSIFGDLTAEEIKAKLQTRREAKEAEKSKAEKTDTETKP